MNSPTQGAIRPNPTLPAASQIADDLVRERHPLAPTDDAIISLPRFKLVAMLAEAIERAAVPRPAVDQDLSREFGLVSAFCYCARAAVDCGGVEFERDIIDPACVLLARAGMAADNASDEGESGRGEAPSILAMLAGVKALLESHSQFESLEELCDAHTVVIQAMKVLGGIAG
ncbi:hypothetical protein ACW73L_21515 [Methylolobus aquaticus]